MIRAGGGLDTCLGAWAPNRTSVTLCSDQTLETDRERCWMYAEGSEQQMKNNEEVNKEIISYH